jgi:hypothetical protein
MKSMKIPVYGSELKSIDFSPWGGFEGFLSASTGAMDNAAMLRKFVPWFNKAVVMTANAGSQLPYEFTRNGEEVDEAEVWGAIQSPRTFMYKVFASLCGGAAYAIPQVTSRAIIDFRYLNPNTVQPQYDLATGELRYFQRSYNAITENIQPKDMLYFWLPDDTVEIGPAQITPTSNALMAAGLLGAMDNTIKVYGENGFIKPMFAVAEGIPNAAERERAENLLSAFVRGTWKRVVKIVNAKSLIPQPVGAGMEDLKGSYVEITRQQIENIAAAFGIPSGLFMSDNAFATEMDALIETWYTTGTFVTLYQTVEDTLNRQMWSRFGIEAKFNLEKVKAFQKEENDKSGSLATLSTTFTSYPEASVIAAGILGYDLTDDQIAAIEGLEPEEEETPQDEEADNSDGESMILPTEEENAIADEMKKWREFMTKPRKREFDCKVIPLAMAEKIRVGLREAGQDQDKITAVFDGAISSAPVKSNTDIKALADSINKLAEPTQRRDEGMNIIIDTQGNHIKTAQDGNAQILEAIKALVTQNSVKQDIIVPAPVVNFSPVIQPSDVSVPVTVQASAPAVNNITVKPADVVFPPAPTEATITTDKNGKKTLKVTK